MFTGIIEGLGSVMRFQQARGGRRLRIAADFALSGTRIGDSIAVSGACLTVVAVAGHEFEADVSPETLRCTNFGDLAVGDRVNLERALRLGDRLDGHLVTGHVDGIGVLTARRAAGNSVEVAFEVDAGLSRRMVPKGSIAVDGVSLTVNECSEKRFSVNIIPHTEKLTTIGFKNAGETVNIENDMIGKYVERLLARARGPQSAGVDMDFLHKTGFL